VRRKTACDVPEAMRLTDVALKTFRQLAPKNEALNIPIERVVRARADMLLRIGDNEQAQDEMLACASDLKKLGVKSSVTEKMQRDARTIVTSKKTPARRPAKRRR
jgi:hypothetical protein